MTDTNPVLTRRRRDTRDRLIDAAYVAFKKHGYIKTSIEQICDLADYTRGAFYSNFASKEDIFRSLYLKANDFQVTKIRSSMRKALAKNSGSSSPVRAQALRLTLHTMLDALAKYLREEALWFSLVAELRGVGVRDAAARAVLVESEEDLYRRLEELMELLLESTNTRLRIETHEVVSLIVGRYEVLLVEGAQRPELLDDRFAQANQVIETVILSLVDSDGQ